MPNLYCQSLRGAGLSDDLRIALFDLAQGMIKNNSSKIDIKISNGPHGWVQKLKPGRVLGIDGILFNAEVEYQGKKTTVTFLVRPGESRDHEDRWTFSEPQEKPEPLQTQDRW